RPRRCRSLDRVPPGPRSPATPRPGRRASPPRRSRREERGRAWRHRRRSPLNGIQVRGGTGRTRSSSSEIGRRLCRKGSKAVDSRVAVLLTAAAGGLLALQAPINAGLGKETGRLPAALISVGVSTIFLGAIVLFSGEAGGL